MAVKPWPHGVRQMFGRELACSFCGRRADSVNRLVAGASAHICEECVAKCAAVLKEHGGFDPAAPNNATK